MPPGDRGAMNMTCSAKGRQPSTSQAEKVFTFEMNMNDNMISTTAITVELILQQGGNLATHAIDRSQF